MKDIMISRKIVWIRIITFIVILAFLYQNIALADGRVSFYSKQKYEDKLSPSSEINKIVDEWNLISLVLVIYDLYGFKDGNIISKEIDTTERIKECLKDRLRENNQLGAHEDMVDRITKIFLGKDDLIYVGFNTKDKGEILLRFSRHRDDGVLVLAESEDEINGYRLQIVSNNDKKKGPGSDVLGKDLKKIIIYTILFSASFTVVPAILQIVLFCENIYYAISGLIVFVLALFPINSLLTSFWKIMKRKELKADEQINLLNFANTPFPPPVELPSVTVMVPVYKESFQDTIQECLGSALGAVDAYNQKGGAANLIVCDDGLMVFCNNNLEMFEKNAREKPLYKRTPEEIEVLNRLDFYRKHNITFVARPRPDKSLGLERKGTFPDGSKERFIAIHPEAFEDDAHLLADLNHEIQMLLICIKGNATQLSQNEVEIMGAERAMNVLTRIINDPSVRKQFPEIVKAIEEEHLSRVIYNIEHWKYRERTAQPEKIQIVWWKRWINWPFITITSGVIVLIGWVIYRRIKLKRSGQKEYGSQRSRRDVRIGRGRGKGKKGNNSAIATQRMYIPEQHTKTNEKIRKDIAEERYVKFQIPNSKFQTRPMTRALHECPGHGYPEFPNPKQLEDRMQEIVDSLDSETKRALENVFLFLLPPDNPWCPYYLRTEIIDGRLEYQVAHAGSWEGRGRFIYMTHQAFMELPVDIVGGILRREARLTKERQSARGKGISIKGIGGYDDEVKEILIKIAGYIDSKGLCVTGDTLLPILRLAEEIQNVELRRIIDVKPGDYVLSLNEETQKIEPHRINGLLDMGIKPAYRLTNASGRSIKTTANHPYLTKNGWKKVSELKEGDEIGVPSAKGMYTKERLETQADLFKCDFSKGFSIAKTFDGIQNFNTRKSAFTVIIRRNSFCKVFGSYLCFLKSYVKSIYFWIVSNPHISSLFKVIYINSNYNNLIMFFNKYRSYLFSFIELIIPIFIICKILSTFKPIQLGFFPIATSDGIFNFFFSSSSIENLLFGMPAQPNRLCSFQHTFDNNSLIDKLSILLSIPEIETTDIPLTLTLSPLLEGRERGEGITLPVAEVAMGKHNKFLLGCLEDPWSNQAQEAKQALKLLKNEERLIDILRALNPYGWTEEDKQRNRILLEIIEDIGIVNEKVLRRLRDFTWNIQHGDISKLAERIYNKFREKRIERQEAGGKERKIEVQAVPTAKQHFDTPLVSLCVGDLVFHEGFGTGKIVYISKKRNRITINFSSGKRGSTGEKTFILSEVIDMLRKYEGKPVRGWIVPPTLFSGFLSPYILGLLGFLGTLLWTEYSCWLRFIKEIVEYIKLQYIAPLILRRKNISVDVLIRYDDLFYFIDPLIQKVSIINNCLYNLEGPPEGFTKAFNELKDLVVRYRDIYYGHGRGKIYWEHFGKRPGETNYRKMAETITEEEYTMIQAGVWEIEEKGIQEIGEKFMAVKNHWEDDLLESNAEEGKDIKDCIDRFEEVLKRYADDIRRLTPRLSKGLENAAKGHEAITNDA